MQLAKRLLSGGQSSPEPFTLLIDTTLAPAFGDLFVLGVNPLLPFNIIVDWGDGAITTHTTDPVDHQYASPGTYTVRVHGTMPGFGGGTTLENDMVTEVVSFGALGTIDWNYAFNNASNLTTVANKIPPGATNMNNMFSGATSLNCTLNGWDVSSVTNMEQMFTNATAFNGNISSWNVGNVTSMAGMFLGATAFNQNIGSWNTGNVVTMSTMFFDATAFNQNIGAWNTSNVTTMNSMFYGANSFNQNIGSWNTGNVTSMNSMFFSADAFNQNIGGWDTSNVADMQNMFHTAISFNQDLSGWCVELIPSTPVNFDFGAAAWVLARPPWGVPC